MLNDAEVQEIDAALAHLLSLGDLDFPEITPRDISRSTASAG